MANEKLHPELNVSIDSETAQGTYSNMAITSHSTSEFVIDFASMLPGIDKIEVRSRIIMTPENAKSLLMSLQDNIAKYETNVRPIGTNQNAMPLNMDIPNIVS
ncbi:MAG: DUF3467 domain-containing protein [Rikenellaceae bacterium]